MKNILFKGIRPALITPFDKNGDIKRKAVKELVDWHLSSGVDGFYICGTTGEGPVLPAKTRMDMAEITVEAVAGRGDVIAHIGSPNPHEVIELTRHADKAGVDGISSLPPTFFFNYTDGEIIDFYKSIADNTHLPVLMYATLALKSKNVTKLIEDMMIIDNIVGIKDTRRNYFDMWRAKQLCGGDINVINGPDEMLICGLSMGADGGIGSTYNVIPEKYVKLYKLFSQGDIAGAMNIQTEINKIIDVLIKHGVNGVNKALKASLKMSGYNVGDAAYPAQALDAQECVNLKKDMEALGYKY